MTGEKYEAVSVDSGYSKYMTLRIRAVARQDFGSYTCVAKNSLGETDGVIKLDGRLSSQSLTPVTNLLYFIARGCRLYKWRVGEWLLRIGPVAAESLIASPYT